MKKLITTITLCMGILLFSWTLLLGQEQESALSPGSQALQFGVSGINLNPFWGSTISYKWHTSAENARRISVDLRNNFNKEHKPGEFIDVKRSDWDINTRVNYTWQHYVNPEAEVKFYYGYGPGIGVKFKGKREKQASIIKKNNRTTIELAGIAYLGVEWFFLPSFSLHAGYHGALELNYSINKNGMVVDGDKDFHKSYGTNIRLGGNGVVFGLSAYF